MDTYVILRRSGWRTGEELQEAAARSNAEGERTPDDIRWIRSYVLAESDGVGTVCVYQASSPRRSEPMPRPPDYRWTRSSGSPTPSSSGPIPSRPRSNERRVPMRKRTLVLALLVLPLLAIGGIAAAGGGFNGAKPATAKFRHLDEALAAGYTFRLPDLTGATCIAEPGGGAMGVHMVNTALLDGTIKATEPEALVYEPKHEG